MTTQVPEEGLDPVSYTHLDLDFAVGSTNVREVNDVLAAMDAMRTSLAESREARWAAERGQREQVASLAHDLKKMCIRDSL